MMTLRTVIADDEPLARELLRLLLAEQENIVVVQECQNGREVIEYLGSNAADLLFLDIEMPGLGGLDIVKHIGVRNLPPTVFVTAYHQHAVKAFDVQAIDYLTKPVEPPRLAQAIERVREKISASSALLTQSQFNALLVDLRTTAETSRAYPSRLLVRDGEKEVFLPVEKIEWIEAAEYYCCLHSNKRRFLVRETITALSNKLDPRQFARIHRSSIVNLSLIREIYREGQAEGSVILVDGQRLRMSKAGKQRLLEIDKA
jgi:two-component system LytT family response regulator